MSGFFKKLSHVFSKQVSPHLVKVVNTSIFRMVTCKESNCTSKATYGFRYAEIVKLFYDEC
jgi:hypothetical protein